MKDLNTLNTIRQLELTIHQIRTYVIRKTF